MAFDAIIKLQACGAIIKLQACDAVIKLQACIGIGIHLSLTYMDSWESMSLHQNQAVTRAYPGSLMLSEASELLSGAKTAPA